MQKKALLKLHLKLIECLRDSELSEDLIGGALVLETTDYRFQLSYEEKRKCFRLIKNDDEIIELEEI